MTDSELMGLALEEARKAAALGEGPVGAGPVWERLRKGAGRAAGPAAPPPTQAEPACFGVAETDCGPYPPPAGA